MSDAEDNTKTGDRESKDTKDKSKEDGGHVDNQVTTKAEDGKDDSGKVKEKVTTPSKKNAKTKNQKKEEKSEVKEEEEEEDDDDDDDGEEDDEGENDTNGKVPLLDQPLQISGTRDRKKVQRFSEEFKPVPKESPKNEIPEGRGQQLGEIPRIEAIIQKCSSEKLKPLFKLLFNRPGRPALVKRYIRKFNGFDFKEGSDQYVRKRASISKLDMASLKDLSRSLDLPVGGSREDIINRLLEFLMEPKDSERSAKESKKKKTASSSSKKSKRQKANSSSKGKKKKAESEDEDESSEAEMEVDDDKESSDEEAEKKDSEEEKDESEEEEEEDKKRKPAKKKPANAKKPAVKKVEPKKEPEKKAEVKTTDKKKRKEAETKSDDESSEDEPLVKKTKQPPTDDEIKSYVKQILEGANLEEITMKTVCKQVYAAYPEFDLAHKKDFIKTTVKSLIST